MSVSIATMGLFVPCYQVGGGAPPYRQNDQKITPYIRVVDVEVKEV